MERHIWEERKLRQRLNAAELEVRRMSMKEEFQRQFTAVIQDDQYNVTNKCKH